jgi:voltage-gated potassium channel
MQAGGSSTSSGSSESPREVARDVITTMLAIAVLTAVYYLLPLPGRMREVSWAILFSIGLVVLAALIVLSVVQLVRAGPDVRVRSLVVLLCVAILYFSYVDVVLAKAPGQFVQLHTRTDSLYFAISTLSTVGFGDVHASGQLARIAVTLQIVFNLVFLGLAVTTLSTWLRHRARTMLGSPGNSPGGDQQNRP